MFIDESYFNQDISIPGTSTAGQSSLTAAITKYEKECLMSVLGYELYELFVDNQAEQIYVDIIEGKEFTFEFCGKTVKRKWIGLQNSEKKSMLAYYVYYFYWRDRIMHVSNAGHATPLLENAEQDNPVRRLARAYNDFVELAGDLYDIKKCSERNYFRRDRTTEAYFDKYDLTTYEHMNDKPSLYNFLLANKASYPTWEFEPQYAVNMFNL